MMSMHRTFILPITILGFLIFITLSGCNESAESIDFADEGPFIQKTSTPSGENYYLDFYPRNIAVYNDGTIRIFTEATDDIIVEDDAPMVEKQLTDEELAKIKTTIEENNFLKLDKDLSHPEDTHPSGLHLTVYTKTDSRKVYAESPFDENFKAVADAVSNHVQDEYYEWLEDIEEYIYEKNPDLSP